MYKDKLGGIEYSFDKYVSETMDGWEIHIVDEREDIDGEETARKEAEFFQREQAREMLEKTIKDSMPKLLEIVGKFIEDRKVTNLETLKTDSKLKSDLVSKLSRELRRKNITRIQFTELVERLEHYREFRDLLNKIKSDEKSRSAKEQAKELINSQKEKKTILEITNQEVDEDSVMVDRKIEINAAKAEAENYTLSKNSEDVLQDMFESLNQAKILTGGRTTKEQIRQQMYMNFFDKEKKDKIIQLQ